MWEILLVHLKKSPLDNLKCFFKTNYLRAVEVGLYFSEENKYFTWLM